MTRLSDRVTKAKAIQTFILEQQETRDGRLRTALVPGSKAKRYQVIVRRPAKGIISTECRLEVGRNGHQNCKGNWGTVCYHSLATIIKASTKAGATVRFCSSYEDAQLLARMGGKIGILRSHKGKGELWLVVTKEGPTAKERDEALPVQHTTGRNKLFKS
jgi:hypothetical protein